MTRALLRPSAYPGFLKEAMWAGMNLALYPIGIASDALKIDEEVRLGDRFGPHIPLRYLDPEAAATPVILLHGAMHNRSAFLRMKRALRRYGFRHVDTMNYSLLGADVEELSERLAERVTNVLYDTGANRVHLVGHSLGGFIARYYIQRMEGHGKVHTCVTLGTPHQGTYAALVLRGRIARDLVPGSKLLTELKAGTTETIPTRFVCFYSNLDSMVIPYSNATLQTPGLNATNILIKDIGHLSLVMSRPVIQTIAELLGDVAGGVLSPAERPAEDRSLRSRKSSSRPA